MIRIIQLIVSRFLILRIIQIIRFYYFRLIQMIRKIRNPDMINWMIQISLQSDYPIKSDTNRLLWL